MKKIIVLILSCSMLLALAACNKNTAGTEASVSSDVEQSASQQSMGIPNPWTEQSDIAAANKACGMNIVFPDELKGADTAFRTMDDKMIEVTGMFCDTGLTFRAMKGDKAEDISGDYNEYSALNEQKFKGLTVFSRSNSNDTADVVYWNDGTNNYSVVFGSPVSLESVNDILDSLITANSQAY